MSAQSLIDIVRERLAAWRKGGRNNISERPTVAPPGSDAAMGPLRPYLSLAAAFSLVVNVLMLVTPLYMLQVYDRVLTSGSVDTLILISLLAVAMLATYIVAEAARRRVMALAADRLRDLYGERLFAVNLARPNAAATLQRDLGDLSAVQGFLSHGMILPLFDLPFTPFFLAILFLVHPLLGWIGVGGALLLLAIAIAAEMTTRGRVEDAQAAEGSAQVFAAGLARQQSAIVGMGMTGAAWTGWKIRKEAAGALSLENAQSHGVYSSLTRGFRLMLQIASLGVGAWLVLQQQATPGVIIAGSILLGRALAPIDQSVGMWRQIINTRRAWRDLNIRAGPLAAHGAASTPLPLPDAILQLENLEVATPGNEKPLLPKFNLTLEAGAMIALVGASGSGKTSLLQTIAAAWPPLAGHVRLGGRDMHAWPIDDRGRYIGYLPQNTELLPGSVGQNIARFTQCEPDSLVHAARIAGVHALIMTLPDGYDTRVGPGGVHLSAGQKQAIGLARALFSAGWGGPSLLLLDEPSANLDSALLKTLRMALATAREDGSIVVMATHDPRLIEDAHHVVVLNSDNIGMLAASEYFAEMRATMAAPVGRRTVP